MTDQRNGTPDDATDIELIVPPEQPPMDDAAGGPQVDESDDSMDEDPDPLQVQGGE